MDKREKARYAKNLELFARLYPLDAYRLETLDCDHIAFCRTKEGELNLVDTSAEVPFYFHSQEGARWEARRWRKAQALDDVDVIYIYGIGLGYYYPELKEWLKEKRNRHVVFIESDDRVMRCFMQTELATEVLNDKRVHIWLLTTLQDKEMSNKAFFDAYSAQVVERLYTFAGEKFQIFALQSYFEHDFTFFNAYYFQLCGNISHVLMWLETYVEKYALLVARNFYINIFRISEAVPASTIAQQFAGIPSIICGAGPSLAKQVPLLKTLKNKAIIVAAGSGMNALSSVNLIPHFAGGLDPFPIQEERLMSHSGSHVPLIYVNRFFGRALQKWRGPVIYTMTTPVGSLSGGLGIIQWFDMHLKIPSQELLTAGYSTSNLLLDAMRFSGSNPVILVGMDLAYTNQRRYAPGVSKEPEQHSSEKMSVTSADGSTVETRMVWCLEATHIAEFKDRYPTLDLLNATEGGMSVDSVPDVKLKDVVEEYLCDVGDIEGWIHGVIQNGVKNKVPSKRVEEVVLHWKSSLERSIDYLKLLYEALVDNQRRMERKKRLPYGIYSGRASLWQVELEQEEVFGPLVRQLELEFDRQHRYRQLTIQRVSRGSVSRQRLQLRYILDRYKHVLKYVQQHYNILCDVVAEYEALKRRTVCEKRCYAPPDYIEGSQMRIVEPALGLDIVADLQPDMIPTRYFYPDGKVKVEAFFKQDRLHGPWSFYGEDGVLLARSWFVDGQKQGRACYYDAAGGLCALKWYRDGEEVFRYNFKT